MDKNGLVSIGLPTYNNAKYIGMTIESLLIQTHKNIEIVVSDNASEDDTKKVVSGFKDPRIKYFRKDKTVSCAANWNSSIELCGGEIIALYHSDDVYEPFIIEKELEQLLSHKELGAVFCLDTLIDENDLPLGNGAKLPFGGDFIVMDFKRLLPLLMTTWENFIVAPTFMARRAVFNTTGYFTDTDANCKFGVSIGGAVDTEFWLKISQNFKLGILKERLIRRRISLSQGSSVYASTHTKRSNHLVLMEHFISTLRPDDMPSKETMEQYEFNLFWDDVIIGRNYVNSGHLAQAREILVKAFKLKKLKIYFRNISNLAKFIVYLFFLAAVSLGISRILIDIFRYCKGIRVTKG